MTKPASPFSKPQSGNNTPQRPSTLASRFGSTPAPTANAGRPANPPATPARFPPSPFTPSTRVNWEMVPITRTLVRFELRGLGDPFHRLLGHPLKVEYGDMKALLKAIEKGGEAVDALRAHLETAWEGYALSGAILMYQWRDDLKNAVIARVSADKAVKLTNNNANNSDDELEDNDNNNEAPPEDYRDAAACYRSIDLALVLNVLARTRAQLLLGDAQLSFDRRMLERALVTDDPRLIALAHASGCIEETLVK